VHQPQHAVAVFHRVDDDPHRQQIVDLAQVRALALQLLPDAVQVLGPALERALDAQLLQPLLQHRDDFLDFAFPLFAAPGDLPHQLRVLLGVQRAEREVLHLPLQRPHAQAVGQRRVNFQRFRRDAALALHGQVPQRAHVVQAVRELDDDDAQVLRHGQEHFSQRAGLLFLPRLEGDLFQLGDALDQARHHFAELFGQRLARDVRVLQHVVEKARDDGVGVHLQLGQNARDFIRVLEVLLARVPILARVGLARHRDGPLDPLQVRIGIV